VSVYRSPKSPYFQYDFQWKGRRFHGSTGCTGRRQAEAVEARIRAEAVASDKPARPPITVDEAAGLYAARIEEKPGYRTSRAILAALVAGLGGNRLLSEITQGELARLVAKRRHGRANSSVNREIQDWRATWRWASRNRYDVGEMPDWGALLLPVAERDPREASEGEEQRLFAALREDLRPFALFALRSGWRLSEVINLCWSDVDMANATAVTRIKGGRIIQRPLGREMLAIISSQPRVAAQVFTYLCHRSRTTHADKRGRQRIARREGERYPISLWGWRKEWKAALEAAGIDSFRFHDLRHTAGTRLLRATGNLKATQKALAHRSIKTTLRYAHVDDQDIRNAYDAVQSRNSPGQRAKKA
jgi:integrase